MSASKEGLAQLRKQGFVYEKTFSGPPHSGVTSRAKAFADERRAAGYEVCEFDFDEEGKNQVDIYVRLLKPQRFVDERVQ